MGMPICNTFIHSGLVPSHIHAVILEERLHDLTSNPPSFCFLFVLLFDTTPRSLSRRIPGQGSQSACLQHTGIIGIPPPPGSPGAALIAWSPAKGAVTGRKYHCQLSGIMAIQSCFWIDSESGVYRSCLKMYCTSMDRTMSCRQSSRTPHVAFVPHDRTANVTDWLDMKLSLYGGQAYSHPF